MPPRRGLDVVVGIHHQTCWKNLMVKVQSALTSWFVRFHADFIAGRPVCPSRVGLKVAQLDGDIITCGALCFEACAGWEGTALSFSVIASSSQ